MAEPLLDLARVIARREDARVTARVRAEPALATARIATGATRAQAPDYFIAEIRHYVYAGDTLLHVAAAAYSLDVARALLAAGALVSAANRRGATPLHYASDGGPDASNWDPSAQQKMVALLVAAGADPNALDKSGVAPLHRAVRTRSTGAVRGLLEAGCDPRLENANGSSPMDLAIGTTGKGGSGSPRAKAEQAKILALLSGA